MIRDNKVKTTSKPDVGDMVTGTAGGLLTPKGQRTRTRMMQAGRAVLEERGYFDATVVEITERSGSALGTFYRYFENKDVLFMQLLESLIEELHDSVAGIWNRDDVLGSLRESSRRYLHAYYTNRRLIGALLQMAACHAGCAQLWWELRNRTVKAMERYLPARISQAAERSLLVSALASMVEQFAYQWFVEAPRYKRPAPTVDDGADIVSYIWYRAIYEGETSDRIIGVRNGPGLG